ncbi:MAG TPA: aminotransferase class V-fold PLP-dependent enzyme [Candidatus Eremiobacteraceae bacterium]|nr:aminotransferase class V-fold PLP-dependent enzyme [Candidatus Eremiobacteraceae bacterium]
MEFDADLFEQNGTYLNTATFGLPPRPAHDAMIAALADWRTGRTGEEDWEAATERARATFAKLVNVDASDVTCGATVSELIGLIAASLPDGARVLTAENDFASTLFPWTVHEDRRIEVRSVPLDELIDAIDGTFAIVAVSHVQAHSGAVIDLDLLAARCRAKGSMLCVDGTQACGWLDTSAREVDFYVCHAYKWLLSPRGSAFMAVRRDRLDSIRPLHAGWWATDDPNGNLFGLPNRISRTTARRLDTSPAWFSWLGTAAALGVIDKIGIASIEAHDMRLARRFCSALSLPEPVSPIVYMDARADFRKLLESGIRASVRAGRVRLSFHLYNTDEDVDRAVAALRG